MNRRGLLKALAGAVPAVAALEALPAARGVTDSRLIQTYGQCSWWASGRIGNIHSWSVYHPEDGTTSSGYTCYGAGGGGGGSGRQRKGPH